MEQLEFEAVENMGECPVCKTQRDPEIVKREKALRKFDDELLAQFDRGKTL